MLTSDFNIKGVQDYALRDGLGLEEKPTIIKQWTFYKWAESRLIFQ